MKRMPLVRIVTSMCAILTLAACDRRPETLVAPERSSKILVPICPELDCFPEPPPPPPPSSSVTPPPIPLANRAGLAIHGVGSSSSLGPLQQLGVRLVRYDVFWGYTYLRSDGSYPDTSSMAEFRRNNIEVLAGIGYRYSKESPPPSTVGDYATCSGKQNLACVPTGRAFSDSFLPEWKNFVGRTIRENPTVRYWAAWNEPNYPEFFTGTQAQYNTMAKALCDTIRAIRNAPGSTRTDLYCVGPDAGLHNEPAIRKEELKWVVAANAAVGFDVISVHIYNWNAEMKAIASEVKAVIPKPLWITETGVPDPSYRPPAADPEFQERDLAAKVIDVRLGSAVDAIFYFDLQGPDAGVLNGYGAPRPAYYALQKLLSASPGSWSAVYSPPKWGRCSGPLGSMPLCDYTANPVLDYGGSWDCVMTVQVLGPRTLSGKITVEGAEITGYRGSGVFGKKRTDVNGRASFAANCGVEQGLYFESGVNGWYISPGSAYYYDGIAFPLGTKQQTRTFFVTR